MEVSNLLEYLRYGEVDWRISPISWNTLRPQVGALVTTIPIRSGEEVSLILQARPMFTGVVPSNTVLLTFCGVLLVHLLPGVASAEILFAAGIIRICGASTIRFDGGGWTWTSLIFRYLNNFLSNILLLVWVSVSGPLLVKVTVYGLLVIPPCASLTVALFYSYPASFIVKLLIASTRLSNLSIFSLVKTASKFYLCEL